MSVTATDDDGGEGTAGATVTVHNVAPVVEPIVAPLDPVQINTDVATSADFADLGTENTHTAEWDWDYQGWDEAATSAGTVIEDNGSGTVTGSHSYSLPGVYTLQLTVLDDDTGQDTQEFRYVVVYDPDGGFVTGGGWIDSPEGAPAGRVASRFRLPPDDGGQGRDWSGQWLRSCGHPSRGGS